MNPSHDQLPGQPAPAPSPPASTPSRRPITRVDVVLRMVWLCFFCVFAVVAGNLLVFVLPQIREALWAFDDGDDGETRRFLFFVVTFVFWAVTAWYVSRLILGRHFEHDTVGTASGDEFTIAVARWLPRLLGLMACLPLALFMLGVGHRLLYAIASIAVSVAFLLVVWARRKLFDDFLDKDHFVPGADETCCYRYFKRIGARGWAGLALLAAVPVALLLAIWAWPIGTTRKVGTPAIILCAIGAWTLFGGMALTYWPKTRGWITLSWLPLLPLIAVQGWNDNHPVDWHAGPAPADARARPQPPVDERRPRLVDHFDRWIGNHPPGQPVYFVAMSGGASRASYWPAVTLGRLEDEARSKGTRFGSNVFLISGVSGGSVGAAAFVSALATWPRQDGADCLRLAMDEMLGRDALAPVVGLMLFPDLVQRFIPDMGASSQRIDRSRGLEETWVRDWGAVIGHARLKHCGVAKPDDHLTTPSPWGRPLAELHNGADPALNLPSVVLNTVRLEDSRRMLQSNLAFALRDADDLLGADFEARMRNVSLAAAAHNSARFPFVSPPGSVWTAHGLPWGHLGDGGYNDVTGTATISGIVEALIDAGRIVRCLKVGTSEKSDALTRLVARKGRSADSSKECEDTNEQAHQVVVIVLDNTPAGWPQGWLRDMSGKPRVWPRESSTRDDASRVMDAWPLVEITGPLRGAVSRSAQFDRVAEQRLSEQVGASEQAFFELRLPTHPDAREPSMNWQLDAESRCLMFSESSSISGPADDRGPCREMQERHGKTPPERSGPARNLADQALQENLARLRALIDRGRNIDPAITNAAK